MNKIKFFSNSYYSELNKEVKAWVNEEKPIIISVSFTRDSNSYLVVAYDDGNNPVTL
jgi:hypothetical protein